MNIIFISDLESSRAHLSLLINKWDWGFEKSTYCIVFLPVVVYTVTVVASTQYRPPISPPMLDENIDIYIYFSNYTVYSIRGCLYCLGTCQS